MAVVGLGGSGHEWASCAISGGHVVAVAEERLCRRKYGLGTDLLAAVSRHACLAELPVDARDIEYAVACSLVPRPFAHGVRQQLTVINHHLAHAYGTFVASGFERAAILVVDNRGSLLSGTQRGASRLVETVSVFEATPDGIRLLSRTFGEHRLQGDADSDCYRPGETDNSLGHFYRQASVLIGFEFTGPCGRESFGEDGKTMGLAPFGDDRFLDPIAELVELLPAGQIRIDARRITPVFERCLKAFTFSNRAAVAYAVQETVQRALLHLACDLQQRTGSPNLCIAGGVGLNSVANGLLQQRSPFRQVFVAPAPSDDGISLGCAYYGMHQLKGVPMSALPRVRDAFLGPDHSNASIDQAIKSAGLSAERCTDVVAAVGERLAEGKIIGCFQGRAEFGPRALGHRSILAAPAPAWVKDRLNHEIKQREWFRPYGPIVPLQRKDDYFDFSGESPFMSFVARVKRPELIPAATHVDGTARLQTVDPDVLPMLHALLEEFGRLTGTPVLINTSFNHAGEPIVETAGEAIDAAIRMRLDGLVLGDRLVTLNGV